MLDLLLVMTLGFLGSFGHCVGMCGPLTVAFSLSQKRSTPTWQEQFWFHGLLNLGRLVSYTAIGAGIGALGSVLVAGGQMAGIDSGLRRAISLLTGCLLIWVGLVQIQPDLLPQLPFLHPLARRSLHERLSRAMMNLSLNSNRFTPALLGIAWGLMPCGFLYAAQIKAAETRNLWWGAATMLAFGLGTFPAMLGVGAFASLLGKDRRSQLFRVGGWICLLMGILTLLRTGEMQDFTGYVALVCLMLALVARPVSRFWVQPLRYRRALGVGAFIFSIAHMLHTLDHTLNWNVQALLFMLPEQQVGMWAGIVAIALMMPLAFTSFDWMVSRMGSWWRQLHLLSVPVLLLCAVHTLLLGSRYLGGLQWSWENKLQAGMFGGLILGVLLVRSRRVWSLLSLERYYTAPLKTMVPKLEERVERGN